MIRKISNIIYISVLAVVLFACGDDSTIEEQGSGTITARVMASNAYPALEEKVVLKVALNDGQDIQSVVWTMEGQTLGEEPELEYTFTKEGSYNISVRVTDKTGNVAAALQKLQVSGKSLRYALQHFDPAKVWIMGHRGNSSNPNIPENSIAGIESCIELGGAVDIVEVDPRMTKDGVIVLMHDETIDRTTTGKGKVKDLTYEQLQSYRLKLADGTVTNHTVPSLYDALVAGRGKIFFDLDFLNKVSPKELYDVVKSCGMLDRVFFYTSNNRDVLQNILDYSPAPIPYPQCENEEHADFLSQQPGVMFAQISLSKTLNGGLSTAISSKGLFVSTYMLDMNGYTYDTQMTQGNYTGVDLILSKGINLIQTDHPQLLDTYLKQRGKR